MELKNKVHVVENIFSKYTIFLGFYKAKGAMPVSNNLHPLSYYSKEAKKFYKALSMKHGILERIESNSKNSQKASSWKPLRYISLGTRD